MVDASLAACFALGQAPYLEAAEQFFARSIEEDVPLIAPPLFESEADSAVQYHLYHRRITTGAAARAQQLLDGLPVAIVYATGMRKRAREIAVRFNQERVYDATYAALAELRGCEFWTADKEFFMAVQEELPYVRFIGECAPPG